MGICNEKCIWFIQPLFSLTWIPKHFREYGGGSTDPVQPLYLALHVNPQIILIPAIVLYVDPTHFCHHRVAPFLSSQSCTILSSYCHHIVIDVFDTMLYHIDTTLYVDSTHLCHHRVASYCHHIIIILSSYYLWRPHVVHYICHHRITPYCHHMVILLSLMSSYCTLSRAALKLLTPPCNYLHLIRATSLISCNQPTQSWRPLIKLSGCYPFCASIIVRRKHIWEL